MHSIQVVLGCACRGPGRIINAVPDQSTQKAFCIKFQTVRYNILHGLSFPLNTCH